MRAPFLFLSIAALVGCVEGDGTANPTPLDLKLELVVEGLVAPVFATAPEGDSRLFIVERNGRIRIVANNALLPEPFLDLRSKVNFVGERGMLSMAFHPQYATNGRFFVYYVDLQGDIAIERFTSTPGSNVAGASEGIVLGIPHGHSEHHGGLATFGPDGMLYLATGDGRCCGDPDDNAQNLNSLLGKILRIDVATFPYTIPPDNPYVAMLSARPEIWAQGLRSPWRFTFDVPTGKLLLGDVGQDAHEEINMVPLSTAGLNYGWPLTEGTACYRPPTNCNPTGTLTLPEVEYDHTLGCSVIGGYVYRGSAIPELVGHYFYSDYCDGWLRTFSVTSNGATDHRFWNEVIQPGTVSFGRDGAGELYLMGGSRVSRIVRE